MHRRARHLNPGHAGANSALDARFLSGFADGDGITTWTSRTGSNSPTQNTANNKPLYKVNIQGGCPAVLCDASSSTAGRFMNFATSPISGATAASCVYSYERTSNAGSGGPVVNFGVYFNSDHEPYGASTTAYIGFAATTRHSWTTTALNVDAIRSIVSKSGSYRVLTNGTQVFSTTTNTVGIGGSAKIGGANFVRPDGTAEAVAYYWTGYLHALAFFPIELTDPLRKRLEHSVGFSFKIACD